MESIHGVDVSWLHHTNKSSTEQRKATTTHSKPAAEPTPQQDRKSLHTTVRRASPPLPSPPATVRDGEKHSYFPGPVTPPALSEPVKDTTTALPSTPTAQNSTARTQPRRPGLLSRGSSEKLGGDGKAGSRKGSWISNISNKFSSSTPPTTPAAAQTAGHLASAANGNGTPRQSAMGEAEEEAEVQTPSKPRESSFFSSLTRKLSAGSQVGGISKSNGKGGFCERRVLNIDPNRERCLVPEMDPSRLRKVSFCVDVEIAGGPRYDDDDDDVERTRKKKDVKLKERAEGEALKHPEALKEEKEANGAVKNGSSKPLPIPKDIPTPNGARSHTDHDDDVYADSPPGSLEENATSTRKKEKKKKSEEERKERKEKRRRRAEENGSIPVELSMDAGATADGNSDNIASSFPDQSSLSNAPNGAATSPTPNHKRDRPTTDPVRIYRRCCQLRETPILKRITEQLMSPACCVPYEPGVVSCLDLTGSRLQLADMVTLGDWLAVVPVKRLLLEDADIPDEGLRCILAGLLAAKRPEPTRRSSTSPKHREPYRSKRYQERAGVIEKLSLKNNPRITRNGWKHISLFLYMCRSIKALDLSMIQFPDSLPPSAHVTPIKSPQNAPKGPGQDTNAAEMFFRCLSQRLGGKKFEELILSECGLSGQQIRKIVDGAIVCGVNRLGFAGNQLDEEGLDSVIHYLKSGVSGGLDIGGNDLRGKLDLIADALNDRARITCWGLSLAGCNLDSSSLKALFPALSKVPNFRFIDLSHNPDLCSNDNGTISLLRRYIGQMKWLKRIHLADVGMSAKQAIALADVLPEGPQLAHLSILENPELTALAGARDEASQEEACALYASYMAAVRVSTTLICIDIDVPSADNSEVVKALAKQVVAYSLRNMERFAIAEATGDASAATADAAASLTQPHGGEQQLKEITVPDVLMHLVGHVEGSSENHDSDGPAPDDDYIVGGTGVVKALQYVLGEKADDLRRSSLSQTANSGSRTPRERPSSSAGFDMEQQVKAKKMSKNLLESARKIRFRLQSALAKEANDGDEMAYRRLIFLDQTLQNMIQRFEEEYPETRLQPSAPKPPGAIAPIGTEPASLPKSEAHGVEQSNKSDDEDEYEDQGTFRPAVSRHNSDVSLASRALAMEEGHLHRLGHRMRREIADSPSSAIAPEEASAPLKAQEAARLESMRVKLEGTTGPELRELVENHGWNGALRTLGADMNDMRYLQEQDPEAFEEFKESQLKAKLNVAQDARSKT